MSNLIPIKLAEQAITSLEADVDRLRSRYAEATQENARLKAEVERLDTLCKQLGKQHSDISCENIRLRKAGDIVLLALWLGVDGYSKEQKEKAEQAWEKAKEGKQS